MSSKRSSTLRFFSLTFFFVLVFSFSTVMPSTSHALDRRVNLLLKTSKYGLAVGALVGGGAWAAGWGGYRNILMGASAGMYTGILLAAYIIATPTKTQIYKGNPWGPRKPVDPGEEQFSPDDLGSVLHYEMDSVAKEDHPLVSRQFVQHVVWMPLLQISWD